MVNMPVRNKSQATLRVMIEPSAQAYDVPSGSEIIVTWDYGLATTGVELDVWDDNFVSIWVTSEVTVTSSGERLAPLKEA